MSVKSILSDIGHGFQAFFKGAGPVAKEVGHVANAVVQEGVVLATYAQPFIDLAFPEIRFLFDSTLAAVATAELSAKAAGMQEGTGPQKLIMASGQLEAIFFDWARKNNINADPTVVADYVDAFVKMLNKIPARNVAVTTVVPVPSVSPNSVI